MKQREWDDFLRACEDIDLFVEDLCIEVEVEGDYEVIEDLPGKMWCDPDGDEGVEIDWDFLKNHPSIEDEVIQHYNLMAAIAEADRYTRRAEQGFYDG